MEESFYSYTTSNSNRTYTNLMDRLQNHFKCCGVDIYTDWLQVHKFIPDSCNVSMRLGQRRGCFRIIRNMSSFYWNRIIICILMFLVVKITVLGLYECSDYAPEVEEKEPEEEADEITNSI